MLAHVREGSRKAWGVMNDWSTIRKLLAPKLSPAIAWSFPTQSCLGNQLAHLGSSSTLASVTRLVQYCVNTCSAVDAAQRTSRYSRRTVASQRQQILEEKAGQARDIDP
jgi:hypothetical protein